MHTFVYTLAMLWLTINANLSFCFGCLCVEVCFDMFVMFKINAVKHINCDDCPL